METEQGQARCMRWITPAEVAARIEFVHRRDDLRLLTPEEAQKVELVEKALPTFFMEWLVDLVEQPRECPCKDTMLRYKKRGDISEDWKQWIR